MKKNSTLSIIAIVLLMSCSNQKSKESKPAVKEQSSNQEISAPDSIPDKPYNWDYKETVDKMDNTKTFFAINTSPTILNFQSPYNGGSSFMLVVRSTGKEKDVYIKVSQGQFISNLMDDRIVRVKFDEEKPFSISYATPTDGSSDFIFLRSESKLLEKLKTSKKMLLECEFFQEGRKQIDFNVEGLVFQH